VQLALECPTQLLPEIQPLADFDWILAHLVLKDKAYADFYSNSTRFKVLDNSVNELLQPLGLDEIKRAASIVKPNLVVPPDFLGDAEKTQQSLIEAQKVFGRGTLLPVVQGSDLQGVIEYVDYLLNLGYHQLAVPYDILSTRTDELSKMSFNRSRVVHKILGRASLGAEVHLLGFTTFTELSNYNGFQVRSIDTGSPVSNGMYGLYFGRDELMSKQHPTFEVMEVAPGIYWDAIYYNIAYLRKELNRG